MRDIKFCACYLYTVATLYVGHNDDIVIAMEADNFSDDQLSALTVLFKMQDSWPHVLRWRVERSSCILEICYGF